MVADIATTEKKLFEDKKVMEVLRSKNETCYKHEDVVRNKVSELRRQVQDAQYDEKMLEDDNAQLEVRILDHG